jgi:hypothetical protein
MDPTGLFDDEPSLQEKVAAMSAALRRQNSLGMIGINSGDPHLAKSGQLLAQQSQQDQQGLEALPQQRLKLAMAQRQNQEEEEARSPQAKAATGLMLMRSLRNMSPEDQEVMRQAPVHVQAQLLKGAQNVNIHDNLNDLKMLMQGRGIQAGSDLAAQKAEEERKLQEQKDAEALKRKLAGVGAMKDLIDKRGDVRVKTGTELHMNKLGLPAGWDWNDAVKSGAAHPPSDLVKQADESTAAAGAIADMYQGVIKPFLDSHPNGALAGEDRALVEPFVQGMRTMAMKANNMGIYKSYDKALLDKIVADPTSIETMLKSATGMVPLAKLAKSSTDEFMQRAWSLQQQSQRVPTKEGRWGNFVPMNSSAGVAPSVTPSNEPTVTVIWKGSPKTIAASKLDAALKAGAQKVVP